MKSKNRNRTCVYVSSFEKVAFSFGNYSTRFELVLQRVFRSVVRCDVSPLLCFSQVDDADVRVAECIDSVASNHGDATHCFIESVRTHAIAFYLVRKLKERMPQLRVMAMIHDGPDPVVCSIKAFSLWRPLHWHNVGRVIDYTPIGRLLNRRILKGVDDVFVLSASGAHAIAKRWGRYANVLQHVALLQNDKTQFVEPSRVSGSLKLFFAGHWWHHKGIDVLLDAVFLLVKKHNQNVELVLTGGCEDEAFAKDIARRIARLPESVQVSTPGYLNLDEIISNAEASDAWVIPYTKTGKVACSGIMNMAFCCGSVIVASNMPQFKEVIKDGENGLLFEIADAAALAETLIRVTQPELRQKLRQGALSTYSKELSVDAVASALDQAIVDREEEENG